MKPTVYIESTIVSYLSARPSRDIVVAAHQQITRDWWEKALPELSPFVSQFVISEIALGDAVAARARLNAVETFPVLEMTPDIADLASMYFKSIDIPAKARTDAFHLAVATWHGLDYMVSWNCTHIASGRVRTIVKQINDANGFATPTICTPEELMEV